MTAEQPPSHPKDFEQEADRRDVEHESSEQRREELLDEGIEESFPASDPVAVNQIT
jgi:hypothetical protein